MTSEKTKAKPKPKKLTAEQLEKQFQELEEEKRKEFNDKYDALCEEYGYTLQPTLGLTIKSIRTEG